MDGYMLILFFILGAVVGSFLNVVLYRMHTGRSLKGRSHCLSCAAPLRWYELVPVVSYLALRGRCRSCGACIPGRYAFVELMTGVSFGAAWLYFGHDVVFLVLNIVLFSFLILILIYDMRHTIIPNEFVLGIAAVAVLSLGYRLVAVPPVELLDLITGALGAGAFFGGLWYVSRGRWLGLGDAKLAAPLALFVGSTGTFSMVVLSFWVGAVISIALLVLRWSYTGGQNRLRFLGLPRTMKSEVPFAPFLIIGFLLVYIYNVDIFELIFALLFR